MGGAGENSNDAEHPPSDVMDVDFCPFLWPEIPEACSIHLRPSIR